MTHTCPVCGPDFLHWLVQDAIRHTAWLSLPRRSIEPGRMLQSVGQTLGAVWFVEQGLLRSHFQDEQGRERNCAFHPEAQWAGSMVPRGASAHATHAIDALESSRVVELSFTALTEWPGDGADLQALLIDALSANLLVNARRESSLMMLSAEQRYAQFLDEQADIASRIALHHVASYLGITNVALSRIRRRMKGATR